MTDLAQWVGAAAAGDRDAFAWLVEQYYRPAYGIAAAQLSDWSAAEDVAQEAFLAAFLHLRRLRNPEQFGPWLYSIVRNLSRRWRRSAQYRERLAAGLAKREDAHARRTPEAIERMENEERGEVLGRGIESLPVKVREAVVLYYLHGESTIEVAQTLGISAQSVRARLYRGRNQLREWAQREAQEWLPQERANRTRVLSAVALGPVVPDAARAALPSALFAPRLNGLPGASFGQSAFTWGIGLATLVAVIAGFWWMSRLKDSASVTPLTVLASPESISPMDSETDVSATNDPENGSFVPVIRASVSGSDPIEQAEPGLIENAEDYCSVSGTVVDHENRPVTGARVIVVTSGIADTGTAEMDHWSMHAARIDPNHHFIGITDNWGQYHIDDIAYSGATSIYASADGRGSGGALFTVLHDGRLVPESDDTPRELIKLHGRVIDLEPGQRLENVRIRLSGTQPFRGRVIDADGAAVAKAVVYCMGAWGINSQGREIFGRAGLTYTDSRGYFELLYSDIPFVVTSVQINAPALGSFSFSSLPFDENLAELRLLPLARVAGTIRFEDGAPAAGYSVRIEGTVDRYSNGKYTGGYVALAYSAIVQDDGTYLIEDVDPGQRYRIHIRNSEGVPVSEDERLDALESSGEFVWERTVFNEITVHGQVLGETTGMPARDLMIECLKWYTKDGKRTVRTGAENVFTDENGRFEVRILEGPGEYHLDFISQFSAPVVPDERGRFQQVLTMTSGETRELAVKYFDQYTIRAHVTDDTGASLEGVQVKAFQRNAADRRVHGPSKTTDAHGNYEFAGFVAGASGWFEINYSDVHMMLKTEPIIGSPGEVYGPIPIVVYERTGISTRLLDEHGQPLALANVRITPLYLPETARLSSGRPSDEAGYFYSEYAVPATTTAIHISATFDGRDLSYTTDAIYFPKDTITDLGDVTLRPQTEN